MGKGGKEAKVGGGTWAWRQNGRRILYASV